MNGKTLIASFAFLVATGALRTSYAQTASPQGFNVNRFEPAERGSEWFALESLDLRGKFRPALGVVGEYQYRPLAIYNADDSVRTSIVRNVYTVHPGFAVTLAERFRLALSIPVVLYQDSGRKNAPVLNGVTYPLPANQSAVGDLRLGLDVRLLGEYGDAFTAAVGAQFWLPTGSREDYTSDGEIRIAPRVSVAGDIGSFVYAGRLSYNYRGLSGTYGPGGGEQGSEFGFAASAGLRVLDRHLVVGPEVYGTTVVDGTSGAFSKLNSPVEGILGMHYTIPADFRIGAGVGTGLTRGYGTPEVRALLNLEWMPTADKDEDGDGIADSKDACPKVAGVASEDPAKNGCPGDRDNDGVYDNVDACVDVAGVASSDAAKNGCPADRDGDGIFDNVDACIDLAGIKSDDAAKNGCPADRDGDGVYDNVDACVDVPGVKSEDPKKNGCPADTDGDGILDKDDACPAKAGPKTADPKTNGCPDPDRDKDSIENDKDACPDEPGKADPDPKKNGCPKAFVDHGVIKILDQVKFKTASAQIEPGKDSMDVLNAVLDVVKKHPEIKGLRVEGHTDNKGNAAANKKLSQDRATSVVKWLVSKGLDKNMFAAQGFGQEKPIDSNDTESGRQNNRRVEFHILDAAPGGATAAPKAAPAPAPKAAPAPAPKAAPAPAPKAPAKK